MNISNSNELQAIIMERNQQQLASDDALFGDAPSKKKGKSPWMMMTCMAM